MILLPDFQKRQEHMDNRLTLLHLHRKYVYQTDKQGNANDDVNTKDVDD